MNTNERLVQLEELIAELIKEQARTDDRLFRLVKNIDRLTGIVDRLTDIMMRHSDRWESVEGTINTIADRFQRLVEDTNELKEIDRTLIIPSVGSLNLAQLAEFEERIQRLENLVTKPD